MQRIPFPQTTSHFRYVPVVVDHSDELPTRGSFMLHQGIQRRLRITIAHEKNNHFAWKDVRELVVGKCIDI